MVPLARAIHVDPCRQMDSSSPTNGEESGEESQARNAVAKLPHGTSLLDLRSALPASADRQEVEQLFVFSA